MKKYANADEFEKVFSKNLRTCRTKSDYTQKQVAKFTRIPLSTIIKLEEGRLEGKMRFILFMKICALYGYTPSEMASKDFSFEHRFPL